MQKDNVRRSTRLYADERANSMNPVRPKKSAVLQGRPPPYFRQSPALRGGRDDDRDLIAGILDCEVGFPIRPIVFIVIRFTYCG